MQMDIKFIEQQRKTENIVKVVKGNKKVSYINTKLKKNKKYYYKVRAYRTVKGKKVYGAFSSKKSILIKK